MDFAALGFALLLVLANGFFVAIEFALVKIRPTQLKTMVEQGRGGASQALKMREKLDAYLSASQVGITLASLALGWVGEPAFAQLVEPLFAKLTFLGEHVAAVKHTVAVAFAFSIITFLHIVVGEQVPKTLAIQKPESTTLALVWPMRFFYFFFFPLIWLLNAGTRGVSRLFGLTVTPESDAALGEDELRMMLASSAEAGVIALPRAELLERALAMVEKTARQVLVPRSQMKYIDLDEPVAKSVADARAAGHTWLPVCRGNLDRIEGLVNAKDLFFLLARGELRSIQQVQQPVLFVPESVTLEQLLSEFRRRKREMAVVVDEHGGTSGIVTVADVVAELVGDVAQLGRKQPTMKSLPGGKLELPGTTQLDDLEHTLEISFDVERGEVTTIAGYLMAKLGRIPVAGDRWVVEGYEVLVVSTEGPRVGLVRIEPKLAPRPQPFSS